MVSVDIIVDMESCRMGGLCYPGDTASSCVCVSFRCSQPADVRVSIHLFIIDGSHLTFSEYLLPDKF